MNPNAIDHFANFEDFGGKDLEKEVLQGDELAYKQFIELLAEINDPNLLQLAKIQLEAKMPTVRADQIDLTADAGQALTIAKLLLADAAADKRAPYNQKTAALNGLNRALTQLQALQSKIYNVDRARKLEEALLVTLRGRDDAGEILNEFRETYERLTGDRIQAE